MYTKKHFEKMHVDVREEGGLRVRALAISLRLHHGSEATIEGDYTTRNVNINMFR